jgi:hypothetical protein
MKPIGAAAAGMVLLGALVAAGCTKTGTGNPVVGAEITTATTTATPATSSSASSSTLSSPEPFELPPFGVVPTERTPLPPNADTCAPDNPAAVTFGAKVADPAAPTLVVGVPPGFVPSSGDGEVAATMTGPDGMSATVTIAATDLAPAAAFAQYGDAITAGSPISSISVLPGELCEYSGQKLMGTLADQPGSGVEFRDRMVHIWTNTDSYVVAIHLQGPTATAGFDDATAVLMADFGVRIP